MWEEVSHAEEGPATRLLLSMLDGEKEPNSLAMAYMARIAAHECGYTEDKKDEKEQFFLSDLRRVQTHRNNGVWVPLDRGGKLSKNYT